LGDTLFVKRKDMMDCGFTFSASDLGGSRRLALIASLVPPGGRVVDIGTDHARIPIALLKKGVVSEVLATDIRRGPLFAARRHVNQENVDRERITFLETNGFEKISLTSDDTVIISGLGGESITQILRAGLAKARRARRLVLQPQTYDEVLRCFLYEVGLIPFNEIAVFDRRYSYLVIVCDPSIPVHSSPFCSSVEKYFGQCFLDKTRVFYRLLYKDMPFNADQFCLSFQKRLVEYRTEDTAAPWSYLAWLYQKLQKLIKRKPFDSKIESLILQLEMRMNT
jgi:tRNA (adenine22-N1)-methyltransferase